LTGYLARLERTGGRGGGPASPATLQLQMTMLRALVNKLGLDHVDVAVPSDRVGPPETLTHAEYGNLVRRRIAARRSAAATTRSCWCVGECGLRNGATGPAAPVVDLGSDVPTDPLAAHDEGSSGIPAVVR